MSYSYTCARHAHEFEKINHDNGWRCNGEEIYGSCKSGFDQFNKSFGHERFKCTVCPDFDLCRRCLEAPRELENTFRCIYHNHTFKKINLDNRWRCNGRDLYGWCKSGFNEFNPSYGYEQFKCTVCEDFNLCRRCLMASKISDTTFQQPAMQRNNTFLDVLNFDNFDVPSVIRRERTLIGSSMLNKNNNKFVYRTEFLNYSNYNQNKELPTDFNNANPVSSRSLNSLFKSSNLARKHPSSQTNSQTNENNNICCVCLTNPKSATLVHQNSNIGHLACCLDCANILKSRNDKCPVCRQNIDSVIQTFNS